MIVGGFAGTGRRECVAVISGGPPVDKQWAVVVREMRAGAAMSDLAVRRGVGIVGFNAGPEAAPCTLYAGGESPEATCAFFSVSSAGVRRGVGAIEVAAVEAAVDVIGARPAAVPCTLYAVGESPEPA